MFILNDLVEFMSGSPQFRIIETTDNNAPVYNYYTQINLMNDLNGINAEDIESKQIKTYDEVNTLVKGDIIFSLISGTSSIVSKEHEGYLYTQNYIKISIKENIDKKFIVYLLNENKHIKKQLVIGLQGSTVLKYTLKQIKDLQIPALPELETQKLIGSIYFKQMKLSAVRNRKNKLEQIIILNKLEEASKNDRISI